ncbi:MAG: hypothetical protein H0X28_05295 [Solirubrobacterales bacterium]|nr:hypothetical protein [Solirubrobacterales bacterium]
MATQLSLTERRGQDSRRAARRGVVDAPGEHEPGHLTGERLRSSRGGLSLEG